jgi:glycolate oxidase FAD binding subunit
MSALDIADSALQALRERIVAAARANSPLRIRGAGTKDFYGEALTGDIVDTRACDGIIDYEPSELVITARCGTPLSQIEATLAHNGQFLAFEPPAFGGDPTIGGVVATGLSGPRRVAAGAVRDFVLGASLLTSHGELLHFGGQVMKNVAGFDVSRLLCGSLGILGLITQVSLKVLPRPRAEVTLQFDCDARQALDRFNHWRAQPLPISATSWLAGVASVRLSGSPSAVRAARDALGGNALDDAAAARWWRDLRDQQHAFFRNAERHLWRLSVPATAKLDQASADLIEWSGALRWLRSDEPATTLRARVASAGGSATLWRGTRDTSMFPALAAANLELHRRLKDRFDPAGIFNRGRLLTEL